MTILPQTYRYIARALVADWTLPVGLLICLSLAGCGGTVAPPAPGRPDAGAADPEERAVQAIEGKQPVTDEVLRTLREMGRLHDLHQAWARPTGADDWNSLLNRDDDKRPAGADDVIFLNLAGTSVTDVGLKELKNLKNLQTLNLTGTHVTGAGLKELKGLTNLRTLGLSNTQVTVSGLRELKGLTNLRTLDLEVTDGALRSLREVGLLHALPCAQAEGGKRPAGPADVILLNLERTGVTEAGLKELKDLKNLQTLSLSNAQVTVSGLKELKDLKNLKTLSVPGLTDGALRSLREVGLLHALDCAGAEGGKRPAGADDVILLYLTGPVTDAGLKELKDLKNLQTLTLNNAVTDAGLKELKGLSKLRTLHLGVTDDGALRSLREVGLLHVLIQAQAEGGKRPASADDVILLNLQSTGVTEAGLKELKDLKNLQTLSLSRAQVTVDGLKELKGLTKLRTLNLEYPVTDGALRSLREVGLLHALPVAKAEGAGRPAGPADVVRLNLNGNEVTAAGLKELKGLTNLRTLDLIGTRVTDVGELKDLTNLQTLSVTNNQGTMSGLKELKGLTKLRTLNVAVTDEALRSLREAGLLHALSQAQAEGGKRPTGPDDVIFLNLAGTSVTDVGLKELKNLKNLQTLILTGTQVTDVGLKELKDLKKLQTLSLPFPVTDGLLRSLREVGLLHTLPCAQAEGGKRPASADDVILLYLPPRYVTDVGLKQLKDLKNLQTLSLVSANVTDVGLNELKDLTNLRTLDLRGTKVTDAGLKELKEALPKCMIRR